MALIVFGIVSCSGSETGSASELKDSPHANAAPTGVVNSEAFIIPGCYQMVLGKDSAFLTLVVSDSLVTGNLEYRWHEKDQNKGTIKGVIRDSLIIADYTFQSEGMTSIREVIFKMENQALKEASGPRTEKNGKMRYNNLQQLQYDNLLLFTKTNCNS